MKKMFLIMMIALFSLNMGIYAQQNAKAYDIVDVMPQFPGGMNAMMKFVSDNVKYPKEAEKKKLEGKSAIHFIVEKDGSISNVSVKKSSHPILDQEAMRVVKSMPKWIPGKLKGKAVRVKFIIPIAFRLN